MRQGTPVASLAEAKPGDLLVSFGGDHISIYLGNGKAIDAPVPGQDHPDPRRLGAALQPDVHPAHRPGRDGVMNRPWIWPRALPRRSGLRSAQGAAPARGREHRRRQSFDDVCQRCPGRCRHRPRTGTGRRRRWTLPSARRAGRPHLGPAAAHEPGRCCRDMPRRGALQRSAGRAAAATAAVPERPRGSRRRPLTAGPARSSGRCDGAGSLRRAPRPPGPAATPRLRTRSPAGPCRERCWPRPRSRRHAASPSAGDGTDPGGRSPHRQLPWHWPSLLSAPVAAPAPPGPAGWSARGHSTASHLHDRRGTSPAGAGR